MSRLSEDVFNLLRFDQASAVPLSEEQRQKAPKDNFMRRMREGLRLDRSPQDAHPNPYAALQVPLVRQGFFAALASPGTHPNSYWREALLVQPLPSSLRRPIESSGASPDPLGIQEVLMLELSKDVFTNVAFDEAQRQRRMPEPVQESDESWMNKRIYEKKRDHAAAEAPRPSD